MRKKRELPLEDMKRRLKDADFFLWMNNVPITRGRAHLFGEYKISLIALQIMVNEVCEWWLKQPHRKPSRNNLLTVGQWGNLKKAVRKHMSDLRGRTLDEAVAILCGPGEFRCNRSQLRGLPREYQVWVDE